MQNHLLLAKASVLAYGESGLKGFETDFFDRADSQAFLSSRDGHGVLAFRGTENFQDIITDFRSKKVRHGKLVGRVHEGFLDGYNAISESISTALKDRKVEYLEVTGHSLGGALALVFTALNSPAKTVVFGSPRVFTTGRWINSSIIRYENNNDIVPHLPSFLPLPFIPTGFRHIGERRYFNANGILHINPSLMFRIRDSFSGLLRHEGPLFSDHYKETYFDLMEKLK